MHREVNRKSQKLSPFYKLADNLPSVSSPLKQRACFLFTLFNPSMTSGLFYLISLEEIGQVHFLYKECLVINFIINFCRIS